MRIIAFISAICAAGLIGACQISPDRAAATAALSHPWHDTAADGGLNAGPAPGESNSIGMSR